MPILTRCIFCGEEHLIDPFDTVLCQPAAPGHWWMLQWSCPQCGQQRTCFPDKLAALLKVYGVPVVASDLEATDRHRTDDATLCLDDVIDLMQEIAE